MLEVIGKGLYELLDQFFYSCFPVFRELLSDPVCDNGIDGQALMSHQFAQPVDRRCFHFEIANAMLSISKIGESIHKMRVAEAEPKHASLRTIKPGAGYGYALMKIRNKMLK
jgi:hypothetical protein